MTDLTFTRETSRYHHGTKLLTAHVRGVRRFAIAHGLTRTGQDLYRGYTFDSTGTRIVGEFENRESEARAIETARERLAL